ncbi:MAG: anti-sigma factor family protein [Bacteroidota bacterium]
MNDQTMEVEQNQACTELLQLVIDGQATQEQHQELMKHLEECENCRKEYLLSKTIKDSLQNHVKVNSTPKDLANSIQNKISETASLK